MIVSQNINGFQDTKKCAVLWNYYLTKKYDIILLQETNLKINKPEQFFLYTHKATLNTKFITEVPDEYKVWLSNIESLSKKEQEHEVAIILEANLAKHIYEIKELKGYILAIIMSFRGKYKVQIISVYNSP